MKRKTTRRKPTHSPKFQFAAPQELWDAFRAVHGDRGASARIRVLMAWDVAAHSEAPPGGTVPGAHSTEQSSTSAQRG